MAELMKFGLVTFTSLFTLVNPLGTIPIFHSLTSELDRKETVTIANKVIIVSLSVLFMFLIFGELIFDFFGITTASFKIVGGILFFFMGKDMLHARLSRIKSEEDGPESESLEKAREIAIAPLAIPMLAGPGSITHVIVTMQDAAGMEYKLVLILAILLVFGLTYLLLLLGQTVIDVLGENGNKIILRLMGLIVMVIAVEFFFSGLEPILQDIFNVS